MTGMQSDGVMDWEKIRTPKTFLKKPFAFSQDTGKNIGVWFIIWCRLVVF